jgi:pullulanase/glycogen debranching enzyme
MIKIRVRTLFDITATGVTGHYKNSQKLSASEWNKARNQQRNLETLTQLVALRTQIMSTTMPNENKKIWEFEFESESNVWDDGTDPVGVLKADSDGVPMLLELDNALDIDTVLNTQGLRQNVWFELIPINNTLEN